MLLSDRTLSRSSAAISLDGRHQKEVRWYVVELHLQRDALGQAGPVEVRAALRLLAARPVAHLFTPRRSPALKFPQCLRAQVAAGHPAQSDLHSALRRRGTPPGSRRPFLRHRRCRKSFGAALHVALLAILPAHGGQSGALPKRAASPPTPRLGRAAPAPADKIDGDGGHHYDAARR